MTRASFETFGRLLRIDGWSAGWRPREQAAGFGWVILMVAVVTLLLELISLVFPIEHVTIVYTIPVLIAAQRWGAGPALLAGLFGIVGVMEPERFFANPAYEVLPLKDHEYIEHITDIAVFSIVAVITGHLAVTVRNAKMRAQAETLRDALIGSVSHELRSPLATIVGSASVLAGAPAVAEDPQLVSLVRGILQEAERLNSEIGNLIDATRISSEGIQPRPEWVDPEDIVNGALAGKRELLKGHRLVMTVAEDLPLVFVDPAMVRSALGQLVENAAKYSPAGTTITVAASQRGCTLVLSVGDEGIGLAADDAEHIFERFYRSPRNAATYPGSGLGLWIARALVKAIGGRVRATSPGPGLGATFSVEVPVGTQPKIDEDPDD